jgi:N-acetylmuramoyl-L-alanine amidase
LFRVYLSPSNQEHNVGVGGYNEEVSMHQLAERVKYYLKVQKTFEVFLSRPEYTFEQVAIDSNSIVVDIHVCLHSDATGTSAPGGGTTAFSYGQSGKGHGLAELLYKYVAPLSPSPDRGVIARPGLYELRHTKAPAALIENFFHTNAEEVAHFNANIDAYAQAIAKAICEYFAVPFNLPVISSGTTTVPTYKLEGVTYLRERGYIDSDHDPLEKLDIGTFGKIIKNMEKGR